jgi:hypothetical protein
MSIILNNGVTNINGTPGINSDVFANRPAATDVAIGSIFIATDTGAIYQSNGATWVTLGGGGGPTPGIDSVLAVGQLLTAGRTIDANTNFLHIDGITNFRVRSGGIDVFRHNTGSGTRIAEGSSVFTVASTGMITAAPTGGGSVAQQGLNFNWTGRTYSFGNYGLGGNSTVLQINDVSQLVYLQNKGVTNGAYFDFSNKFYLFGRLNVGSEIALKIDEFNDQINFIKNGLVQGLNIDYSATNYQFGGIDGTIIPECYLQVNQNNGTIFSVYNSNDNGLYLGFNAANRKFYLGDYQGTFNSTSFEIDDDAQTILIKNSQTTGSTTIEGNQLIFTGANLESNTSSGSSGQHLVITLNGVVYHIDLKNP